ncbi:type II toxin-antitoxin system HicB family antitoxin [Candidatus Saccharibacteria bacterium]|nr:MAG: type II toxin-antitoxin system HicB family antitoxin [Candidatus Saccharibacteria bacterium]
MKQSTYQTVVYQEGSYYVAQCLNVDVSSFGTSPDEALLNLHEALELYFEDTTTSMASDVKTPSLHTLRLNHA